VGSQVSGAFYSNEGGDGHLSDDPTFEEVGDVVASARARVPVEGKRSHWSCFSLLRHAAGV
jgi:hypothetical protein